MGISYERGYQDIFPTYVLLPYLTLLVSLQNQINRKWLPAFGNNGVPQRITFENKY